ncbi:cell division protein ZipA [Vibrio maerlii]|uniref:cell division protein ZipA n=1 Tax=Vibrio maerlii TaxID=2231648 RepID=UPI000E3B9924|nr:cell division protein ZipA [Vibrio maerlii]
MQELRLVLIIVGGLAIAALLFHGLWTSKKEGKTKFGDKPLGKLSEPEVEDNDYADNADDFEVIRKDSPFGIEEPLTTTSDPLLDSVETTQPEPTKPVPVEAEEEVIPSFSSIQNDDIDEPSAPVFSTNDPEEPISPEPEIIAEPEVEPIIAAPVTEEPQAEDELEVIVLNVHAAGDGEFVGTELFDSMQQNGLLYGEMDIFHRHADLSGTGKVLFSVANMMQPGTLAHGDPAEFTTKGISFFMTLPCFGDAEQNFKLMLRTAQQIADDLGGHVLDDQRNLMTPNRQDAYRKQVQDFKAKKAS